MNHMRRMIGLWFLLGLLLAGTPAFGQAAPDLEVDAVAARSEAGATRLDVYTRVPFSSLQFLAANNAFRARYEATIDVHELADSRAGDLVQRRVFEQEVQAADFVQTQTDRLFDRAIQSLELAPGPYLLRFRVEDQASSRVLTAELAVNVRDLSRPFAVSDLILIDAYDAQANSITPTVSSRVGSDRSAFRLFYEIYTDEARPVRVSHELLRIPKRSGPPSAVRALFGFGASDELDNAEVSYEETEPRRLRSGRNQYVVEIPIHDLTVGEYLARVVVQDESGRTLARAERPVTLHWTGLAEHVRELDDAIAQLSYIAKKREIDHIRAGRTEQERLNRFREFWNRRDPTPGTARNERMEEYYYRVAYANRQFGLLGQGWQTDRGEVMLRFGEPDFVDRHALDFSVKPYEVWYYYQIGRRFVFVDESGSGDYRLMVPYWDERTRLR